LNVFSPLPCFKKNKAAGNPHRAVSKKTRQRGIPTVLFQKKQGSGESPPRCFKKNKAVGIPHHDVSKKTGQRGIPTVLIQKKTGSGEIPAVYPG
jgi:hypothetical protein